MHMTATGSGTSSQGADEKGPHRVAPGGAPAFAYVYIYIYLFYVHIHIYVLFL